MNMRVSVTSYQFKCLHIQIVWELQYIVLYGYSYAIALLMVSQFF